MSEKEKEMREMVETLRKMPGVAQGAERCCGAGGKIRRRRQCG